MNTDRKQYPLRAASMIAGLVLACTAQAAPVATYDFNDGTLNANESGVASLIAINPLVQNQFITDTVFGDTKTVYRFSGNASPVNEQAGLNLNTTGLLSTSAYSVDIIFSFDADGPSWERILDASNRSSDDGFYVEPGHNLQVFPVGDGPNPFTFGQYHRVTLTNNGIGHVTAYLDGALQFDLITNVMDFNTYGAANPNRLLTFFADNTLGGGQGEYMNGEVSLIQLYDTELNAQEVSSIPEPASLVLLSLGLLGLGWSRRKPA